MNPLTLSAAPAAGRPEPAADVRETCTPAVLPRLPARLQPAADRREIRAPDAQPACPAAWDILRARVGRQAAGLHPPLPSGPGCCAVCRGPTRPGYLRCFRCAEHRSGASRLLADIVAPVAYSVAGSGFARRLWQYKSDTAGREAARAALRVLLLVFLRDHGRCVWRAAGMTAPSHVAVVPSGRGRPGVHPLRELIEPYLALDWVPLLIRSGDPVSPRDLLPGRFQAAAPLAGASVLLLDDTWTSGASAQSAAAALKLAGARNVAAVPLGRHVNFSDPAVGPLAPVVTARSFRLDRCALHEIAA